MKAIANEINCQQQVLPDKPKQTKKISEYLPLIVIDVKRNKACVLLATRTVNLFQAAGQLFAQTLRHRAGVLNLKKNPRQWERGKW